MSLRARSVLALSLAHFIVLAPTALFSWLSVNQVRSYFGNDLANNITLLNRETLLASTLVDLALVRTLADSAEARDWLLDETRPQLRRHFFDEVEDYRLRTQDRVIFVANALTANYYFVGKNGSAAAPRRLLNHNPQDAWFFATLQSSAPYTVNVAHDTAARRVGVWINIPVIADNEVLGVLGTYHELTETLASLGGSARAGLTPMVIDRHPAVQAPGPLGRTFPERSELVLAATQQPLWTHTAAADHAVLEQALAAARRDPFDVQQASVTLDGVPQQLSIAYAQEIDWYVITAMDPARLRLIAPHILWLVAAATIFLVFLLLACVGLSVERALLYPLRRLQAATAAVADGKYDLSLPPPSNDEIGDLTRAFGAMAARVRNHTAELEDRVQARTLALEQANAAMAAAQKKIHASLDYAALLQGSLLPQQDLMRSLGKGHLLIWQPRDAVGGDFYVFHRGERDYLTGVLDCAGHGVPGALMTMLMHAIVNLAVQECGRTDPAALLTKCDAHLRDLLNARHLPQALAINTDAAFLYVNPDTQTVRYAGAAIGLYATTGGEVSFYRGSRRALGSSRSGRFQNVELPSAGRRFYVVTDGLLDQAGGADGYGFGEARFTAMLRAHATLTMPEQAVAFMRELAAWQGGHPQRDDITVLGLQPDSHEDP